MVDFYEGTKHKEPTTKDYIEWTWSNVADIELHIRLIDKHIEEMATANEKQYKFYEPVLGKIWMGVWLIAILLSLILWRVW